MLASIGLSARILLHMHFARFGPNRKTQLNVLWPTAPPLKVQGDKDRSVRPWIRVNCMGVHAVISRRQESSLSIRHNYLVFNHFHAERYLRTAVRISTLQLQCKCLFARSHWYVQLRKN
jgi:hypothetical protein